MKILNIFIFIIFVVLTASFSYAKSYEHVRIIYGNGMEHDRYFEGQSQEEFKKISEAVLRCFISDPSLLYVNSGNNFMQRLSDIATVSTANDLTVIVLAVHGTTVEEIPRHMIEDDAQRRFKWNLIGISEKYRRMNGYKIKDHFMSFGRFDSMSAYRFLDTVDKIGGTKVILVTSCYSGRIIKIAEERYRKGNGMQNTFIMASSSEDNPTCTPKTSQNLGYAFFQQFMQCGCAKKDIKKAAFKIKQDRYLYTDNPELGIPKEHYDPQTFSTLRDYIIEQK